MENFVTRQKRMRAVDGKQEIYLEWPKASMSTALSTENHYIINFFGSSINVQRNINTLDLATQSVCTVWANDRRTHCDTQ